MNHKCPRCDCNPLPEGGGLCEGCVEELAGLEALAAWFDEQEQNQIDLDAATEQALQDEQDWQDDDGGQLG